jgi:ribonuclease BN (tRNA processing enzyme)
VRVLLVPSSVGHAAEEQNQYLTSYLLGDSVAVDVGCLGFYADPKLQSKVKHIVITHTHIDHIASLPIFVENAYEGKADCVTIHAGPEVLDCLRRDMFNDRVWPDFVAMSGPDAKAPFLKLREIAPHRPFELEGLRFTPVPVSHLVPTLGFLVEDDRSAILIVSDTGPTEEIWRLANAAPRLAAVFLEAAFPDELAWLADASKHLCTATFAVEVRKLQRPAQIIAVHIKARWRDQIIAELDALKIPNFQIGRFGMPYEY